MNDIDALPRMRLVFCGAILLLLITACGSIPYRTARNEAICPTGAQSEEGVEQTSNCNVNTRFPVPRARKHFEPNDKDLPDVFVGLALSGGGSRAANFAMAAMEQLEVLGLLRHVAAISATSGGAVAGAFYALHGPDLDWKASKEAMGTNFLTRWVVRSLLPHNLITTSFTHEDRSDLMADIFDDTLFHGATFEALGAFKPGRPIFLVNATDAMQGMRFSFDHETFRSRLNSRLDTFPISQAVIASAAFPGAFNSVTLKRYPLPVSVVPGRPRPPPPIGYEHLLDGGPTDNIGIESLLELAASHQKAIAEKRGSKSAAAGCFLFVLDAYPKGVPARKAWDPDPRSFFDHFVDLNIFEAFDALLTVRRHNLLSYVGLGQTPSSTGGPYIGDVAGYVPVEGLGSDPLLPANQLVQFDVPLSLSRAGFSWALIRPVEFPRMKEGTSARPSAPPEGYFRCTAWHLNLSGLMDVKPFVGKAGEEPMRLRRTDEEFSNPSLLHRVKLNRVVSQIDTSFKLTGPRNCSSRILQDSLYAAAFVTVREDHLNRSRVCEWFENAHLLVSKECRVFPGNKSMDLKLSVRATGPVVSERPGDSAVECVDGE